MKACATSKWGRYERLKPSGSGNLKPKALLNGSPDNDAKREFHIKLGKSAVLIAIGVRRMLRGPVRSGPTIPLFSIPIAIDCVSPNPFVGEWQPAHVLSLFRPVMVSNQRSRPRFAKPGLRSRPSRCATVDST